MATVAGTLDESAARSPIARGVDRWIYVFTAALFIVITLTGFIPDSREMIAAVNAGERPPLPLVLHMHAILMGSFLLLLLAQTSLAALGRYDLHRRLGLAAMVLAPALVVVGMVLATTNYHALWSSFEAAPPAAREQLLQVVHRVDNILLLQLRIGLTFPLFLAIGLGARGTNAGLHKRMMFLATAMALPAGIDRIGWLPTTLPASPLAVDLYMLLALAPMIVWDVARSGKVHKAYWIWLAVNLPVAALVYSLWSSPWWQAIAPQLMRV